MDIGIGATLREARNRRKVDLSEVEAATQIRVRYLRAIESEEWDVLPGDVYARSFIRTYASHLGLDGERLAEDFKRARSETAAGAGDASRRVELPPVGGRSPASPGARRRVTAVAIVAGLAGLAIAIGLATGGEDPAPLRDDGSRAGAASDREPATASPQPAPRPGHSLALTATGEVWVCLLDAEGQPLVDGQILFAGAEEGPFRSGSFTVSFGNGEVSMTVDGKEAEIPETASPIGYAIGDGGTLEQLAEGERPDCA